MSKYRTTSQQDPMKNSHNFLGLYTPRTKRQLTEQKDSWQMSFTNLLQMYCLKVDTSDLVNVSIVTMWQMAAHSLAAEL